MLARLLAVFEDSGERVRERMIGIYVVLAVMNIGAWLWAIIGFGGNLSLLGVALVVYGLGLRHAVDADHIAAIDNVTRKLMQEGQRPVTVGFFFALGHSTVVIIASLVIAVTAASLADLSGIGGIISTGASTFFLFVIALMNIMILTSILQTYRQVRRGGSYVAEDLDILLNKRGFLARIFRPVFKIVTRSWLMYPVGFLFGLGFDTATEVAVFGVAAAQMAKGMSIGEIAVFPFLFAAGMSLVDTSDGILMLRAYDWAFVKPMRKLYYNIIITSVSVVVALFIGGIEGFGLLSDSLGLQGGVWDFIGSLNSNFNDIGFAIIAIFVIAWGGSFLLYRWMRLDEIEVTLAPSVSSETLDREDPNLRVQAAE
jgi:nickel/cobalt transporter (NiCoT) family protein